MRRTQRISPTTPSSIGGGSSRRPGSWTATASFSASSTTPRAGAAPSSRSTESRRRSATPPSLPKTPTSTSIQGSTSSRSCGRSTRTCAVARRLRRQHDHPAACQAHAAHPRADAGSEDQRGDPGLGGQPPLLEGPDPGAVPERSLLRQPGLRRRGRGATYFGVRRASWTWRSASRRAAPGALGLRPVHQPEAARGRQD